MLNKSSKASAKRTGVWGGGGEEAGSPSSPFALFIDTQFRPASALIIKKYCETNIEGCKQSKS